MFHFPGCPPHELWIHSWVTGHCPGRVPPFGNSRINVYLQLPSTYRSLSRPSSAISALASTLRSFSLDLASTIIPFLRLLRWNDNLICEFFTSALLTGIFRRDTSQKSVSFLCSFQGACGLSPLPFAAAVPSPPDRLQQPPVGVGRFSHLGLRFLNSLRTLKTIQR